MWVLHMSADVRGPEDWIPLGLESDVCEPPSVGASIQTQILHKNLSSHWATSVHRLYNFIDCLFLLPFRAKSEVQSVGAQIA